MNLRFLCIVLWVLMLACLAGPAFAKITIGVVDGDKNAVVSADQARAIGHELAVQLQEAVDVKTYPDQAKLFQWLNQFAMLDLAILPLQDSQRNEGTFLILGALDPAGQVVLVARQGVPGSIPQRVGGVLQKPGFPLWEKGGKPAGVPPAPKPVKQEPESPREAVPKPAEKQVARTTTSLEHVPPLKAGKAWTPSDQRLVKDIIGGIPVETPAVAEPEPILPEVSPAPPLPDLPSIVRLARPETMIMAARPPLPESLPVPGAPETPPQLAKTISPEPPVKPAAPERAVVPVRLPAPEPTLPPQPEVTAPPRPVTAISAPDISLPQPTVPVPGSDEPLSPPPTPVLPVERVDEPVMAPPPRPVVIEPVPGVPPAPVVASPERVDVTPPETPPLVAVATPAEVPAVAPALEPVPLPPAAVSPQAPVIAEPDIVEEVVTEEIVAAPSVPLPKPVQTPQTTTDFDLTEDAGAVPELIAQPDLPQALRPPGVPILRPGRVAKAPASEDDKLLVASLPKPIEKTKPYEPPKLLPDPVADPKVVYIVPFVSVMVPREVESLLFDKFIEQLNEGSETLELNFVILKEGLDKVANDWLLPRKYVTGEVYGYVEDAGSTSTDLRTKARMVYFKANQQAPAHTYEFPARVFFNRDRSTLAAEREKLAESIAKAFADELFKVLKP